MNKSKRFQAVTNKYFSDSFNYSKGKVAIKIS